MNRISLIIPYLLSSIPISKPKKRSTFFFFSLSLPSIIHFFLCSSITQIPQRCSWNFGKLSWKRKSDTCELKSVKSFQVSNGKKVTSHLIDQITYLPQDYGVLICTWFSSFPSKKNYKLEMKASCEVDNNNAGTSVT